MWYPRFIGLFMGLEHVCMEEGVSVSREGCEWRWTWIQLGSAWHKSTLKIQVSRPGFLVRGVSILGKGGGEMETGTNSSQCKVTRTNFCWKFQMARITLCGVFFNSSLHHVDRHTFEANRLGLEGKGRVRFWSSDIFLFANFRMFGVV